MAAQVVVRWVVDGTVKTGALADIASAQASDSPVWVDVFAPDDVTIDALSAAFPLHPLAREDVLHYPQRPKLDAYGENLFMVWVAPRLGSANSLDLSELDVFLGVRYLITAHRDPIKAIDSVAAAPAEALSRGAEWTLHEILDCSVDDLFPLVDMVGEELDRIEDELLDQVVDSHLQSLYSVKRIMLNLHKVIGPERDVLRALARHDEFVSQEAYLYFQDVGDHVARVSDAIDTYRDVASSVMDIYLSAISNRLNVVMKQLTVVATIFMPLTLITGIYGMNLTVNMWPATTSTWGFSAVMGSFVVIVVAMLYLFKRRGWW